MREKVEVLENKSVMHVYLMSVFLAGVNRLAVNSIYQSVPADYNFTLVDCFKLGDTS